MKTILVIDGNSIINRAYYGIRALSTKDGRPTNAVYGMLNIILRHMEAINPTYAAVAFDLKAPNFRKQRFSYYKEGRHETPPDLIAQFDDAKECLRLLGLHTLELEGYEADDILGTVSAFAEADEDTHAYVLSGDRDLLQLISPKVTVLLASTGETVSYDRDAFHAKYGIEPQEFIDLKALMGDSSDNIPGVPGVGEKTAIKLISEFHSLEGIYEHLDAPSITKGLRAKLEAGRESAYDSRWLATICRTVPLDKTCEELRFAGIHCTELYAKCAELELHQLIRKLKLSPLPTAALPSGIRCVDGEGNACELPTTEASVSTEAPLYIKYVEKNANELCAALAEHAVFAITAEDNETAFCDGENGYLYRGSLAEIASLFDGSRAVVTYDGKRLLRRLYREGVDTSLVPRDLLLYGYILKAGDGQPSLDTLLLRYLSLTVEEGDNALSHFLELERQMKAAIAEISCEALLEEIELPLSPVLARMEHRGFRIDREGLIAFGERLAQEVAISTENVYALAGEEFNINSPKQLGEILFERLELPTKGVKKNKNGYSTDAETLSSLRRHHPIIDELLAYRHLSKLHSTYALGLLRVADEDGFIHTEFKQALTATGRLSSAEPNLQNIPIRTRLGREMRRVFVPSAPDYLLIDADYSQIELRLLAAFSGDPAMCEAFRVGEDIHRETAAAVFGVPQAAVTDEMRKQAKAVNFGIVYGIGAYSLSQDIGVSVAEANRYMESYFAMYPSIRAYLDQTVENAERTGYTATLHGRRREIPELSSTAFHLRAFGKRVARNSPIQGSAADIIKLAMIRTDARLRAECPEARLILQVHDELIVEAPADSAEQVRSILKSEMEGAVSLCVPLTVSTAIGKNWLEAEH